MASTDNPSRDLPDVAHQAQTHLTGQLDWVGMNNIQVPLLLADADGRLQRVSARVDAHVNLKRTDRGIHMSRLYLMVEKALASDALSPELLRTLLASFLASHESLSDQAQLRIRFEQLIRRPALKSDNSGWRAYPVTIHARMDGQQFRTEWHTDIVYSSTCPASAALSRHMVQEQFARDFDSDAALDREAILAWLGSERGMVATPHAQRSIATMKVRPAAHGQFETLLPLIDQVETALGTPVQTAVKREDEQAFALANGQNLLFCEDAARRIQRALDSNADLADFAVRVSHEESLHPHDAVAYATKGIAGGFDAGAFAD